MKSTVFLTIISTVISLASAGIVITPIYDNQIVDKKSGDCFFGVVTPYGYLKEAE
ncbi:Secreted virulence factor MC69 [Cladobotryum mycophilum]|uniref:Secreted virulence factor MC69 n=1 Tax=Cladobotryum mycophilum TaxID=491253 RepID=A0ABR0ST89_9HYPO